MAVLKLYKCTLQSCQYVFRSGHVAKFAHGRYATEVPEEIAELDHEVLLKHPNIFIDPMEEVVDTDYDPRAEMKKKMREEILAEIAAEHERASGDLGRDMGSSDVNAKFKPASTTDIAPVAAGGDGANIAARLKSLSAAKALSPDDVPKVIDKLPELKEASGTEKKE